MISEIAKQIINKVENCKHLHQTKDEMFNTAKVCQDCGLVIFADQQIRHGDLK